MIVDFVQKTDYFFNTTPARSSAVFALVTVMAFIIASFFRASWAEGDVYTYEDKNGVTHFTNIKRGKEEKKYKKIYKTPPKETIPHRKGGDKIPARDQTKERFTRYDSYIRGASRLYHIPIPLIRAVIKIESNYDPRVVSSKGAKGLMQMMEETAKDMGVVNIFDPRENIYGGTRYLRVLANMFNGDLILTIAAHHAGPGAVKKHSGIPPYKTTRKYVRAVLSWYYRFRTKTLDQILAEQAERRANKRLKEKKLLEKNKRNKEKK